MAAKTEYQLMVRLGASASPSWKKTLKSADAALSQLDSYATKIMAGISAGVAAAGVAATAALSSAMETYSGFESEMATVKAISGATALQFLEQREAALEAGRSTVFTAQEAASALEYMALAGWSVEESLAGLNPILTLAAATGKELQRTSDLVTDSMSALGLGVADLGMYLDKLVAGNNNANNTAEQLMEGLVGAGGAARVLGADLDDTVTALGVLADNGQKGVEAGTTLNAIMSRLAGNTAALKELDKLNVDLWDDEGKFVGFEESLIRINGALSNLTDEDKALSMKNIAGTDHFSEMEYLLGAVQEVTDESGNVTCAWQELEAQVAESSGALKTMYDTTTDTLLFAQKRLASAKEDMQIRVADVFADDAKDFLIWLSEQLPEATDSIVAFAEAHRGEFADALEGLGSGIEWLWENGIAAGKWIIKHKGAVTGAIGGIAASCLLLKTALVGVKIVEFLTNPLTAIPAAAGLALAGIGAIAGALRDAETAAVNADLADHFGSISLSMSEIEETAKSIVSSECLTGVLDALEEFDELDTLSGKMESAARELEKLNWKISIGLELTEGEAEEYQRAIADYVKNAQEYALQTRYAVSISMDLAFSDSDLEQSNLVAKVNQFYSDKYEELARLGAELNETITKSFNDGLLNIDPETVMNLQRDMAEIEKSISVGEYNASLSLLDQEYSGKELTAETLTELMGKLDEQTAVATEAYRQEYKKMYGIVDAAYQGGALTEEEYNSMLQTYADNMNQGIADVNMQATQFLLNTLNSAYADEIGQYDQRVAAAMEFFNGQAYDDAWKEFPEMTFNSLLSQIADSSDDTISRDLAKLLEPMEGSIDEMYALKSQWDSLSPEMQEKLKDMYSDIERLYAMSVYSGFTGSNGDIDWISRDVINKAYEQGGGGNAQSYVTQTYIMSNAEGGIYDSPILTTFAEEGPEAAVPLDGSERAKSIWAKAGQILGMLPQSGNRDRLLLEGITGSQQEIREERSIQISYNPVVNIQGHAAQEGVQRALAFNLDELREMIEEIQREDRRVAFV